MQIVETAKSMFNKLKPWQKVVVVLFIIGLIASPFTSDDENKYNPVTENQKKYNQVKTNYEATNNDVKEKEVSEPVKTEKEAPQANKDTVNQTLPEELPQKPEGFTIIQESQLHKIKKSIDIRLQKKISEQELTKIAKYLKASKCRGFERVFMVYYLPDMTPGSGAWATTHYLGESMSVKIMNWMVD